MQCIEKIHTKNSLPQKLQQYDVGLNTFNGQRFNGNIRLSTENCSIHVSCMYRPKLFCLKAGRLTELEVTSTTAFFTAINLLLLVFCCSQQQVNDYHHLAGGSRRRRTADPVARHLRSSHRWESCLGKIAEVVSRCLPRGFYIRVSFSWIVPS